MKRTIRIAGLCGFTLFLLSMAGCGNGGSPVKAEINEGASLPDNLPYHPLQWRVISTSINKPESSMYTLYGNDLAVEYARANSQNDYPAGAVLALVGWVQRDDERWFGGKIPDRVRSVEFVAVNPGADHRPSYTYQDYEGNPLKKTGAYEGLVPNERVAYLLSQRAAVMP
jgi:hypothetical protein